VGASAKVQNMLAAFIKFVDCGYYTIFKCTYHYNAYLPQLGVGEGGLVGGEWTTKSPIATGEFSHILVVHTNPRWRFVRVVPPILPQ